MKSNSLMLESLEIGREGVAFAAPISMEVAPGTIVSVEGANGSGKTTLLKILAGLMRPLGGRFAWEGAAPLYVGHRGGMLGDISVRENVAYWAAMHGASELIPTAMHYFDLGYYADMKLRELSAGWQRSVCPLTRLITGPASLWLLDEPMGNLDKEGVVLLQSLIQTRVEQRGIVVLTSHLPIDGPQVMHLRLDAQYQAIGEAS